MTQEMMWFGNLPMFIELQWFQLVLGLFKGQSLATKLAVI